MDDLQFFQWSEFECPHCGDNGFNEGTARKLDKARELSGVPYVLNSAYRCEEHNLDVGGVRDGSHPSGYGVDIRTDNARIRFLVLTGLLEAGFDRIGIYPTHVHTDDDPTKDPYVIWHES